MERRIMAAALLFTLSPHAVLRAQGNSTAGVGWYNGDCALYIPGQANWYLSDKQFTRMYDDFVVPSGGWTVAGVFSNNSMTVAGAAAASWEIRSGVSAGNGGTPVASGLSPATATLLGVLEGGYSNYRIQVDGLSVPLTPGTYWLSVTPVVSDLESYVCPTLGANAAGNPLGNAGRAYVNSTWIPNTDFQLVQATGQGGTSGAFSLGVLVAAPTIASVVNAASFASGPVLPGELVTIAGAAIGPPAPATLVLDAGGKVATSLGGVEVWFGGFAAPLTYVSGTQINAVVPYEIAAVANPSVEVDFGGKTTKAFALAVAGAAPALFTSNGSGAGAAAVLNQDNSYNGANHPAAKGSYVALFLTGEGQTNPAGVTGKVTTLSAAAPLTPQPLLAVTVQIGGQPATVAFYGEAPGVVSGVLQINVQIPAGVPSGSLPVWVSVGGYSTPSGVTIAVE